MYDYEKMISRALSAYFKFNSGGSPDILETIEYLDKHYVVLGWRANGEFVVYRIKNNGALKKMKRYPKGLTDKL